ncbi:FliM/FliN family flagellar motor switch protein [Roseateles sp.]|uniref:FliM/FliN family flagellar motor switch protein n=1 Tax=Roseateles sp. TaxID=1971397 RepID=UPI0031D374BE
MQPTLHDIDLQELTPAVAGGPPQPLAGLEGLKTLPVQLDVLLGTAQVTVGDLMACKPGEVLRLDRTVEQGVDLVINGHVVARGRLVALDDSFAIQLTETPDLRSAG